MTDGTTTFVNASACTVNFLPMNPPIVFDLPNPRTTWLEEAGSKTPAVNQEKGAANNRGRWGPRPPVVVWGKKKNGLECVNKSAKVRTKLGVRPGAPTYWFFFSCLQFFHPEPESSSRAETYLCMRPFRDNVVVREAKPAKRPDLKTERKEKKRRCVVCSAPLCFAPVFRPDPEWAHARFSPSLKCKRLIKAGARGQREVPHPIGGAAAFKRSVKKLVDVVPPSLVTDFTSISTG